LSVAKPEREHQGQEHEQTHAFQVEVFYGDPHQQGGKRHIFRWRPAVPKMDT
jgi:hypothetical protein